MLTGQMAEHGGLERAVGRRPARRHAAAELVHRESDRLAVQIPVDEAAVDVGAPADRRGVAEVVRDLGAEVSLRRSRGT
jgi:hypothetical protein